ncbi:MAG: glycine--tRNA ligase subunit beta [Fusobacteriota bacterium]
MDILLEVGVEEIPARFLIPALEQIKKGIKNKLEEKRIGIEEINTYGTPRRLILELNAISEKQEDLRETNTGPSKDIAYDDSGEPTKAAIGFAKSQGVEIIDLEIVETKKGEYIAASTFTKGKSTREIIPEILKGLILNLDFAKTMKWGDKKVKFVRPIRWILAMADNELLEINIAGIDSELISYGHRFFGNRSFEVESKRDYFRKVKENNVIIDIEERKTRIVDAIEGRCSKVGEKVLIDDDLLEEVANLVEYPYPMVGTFNVEFLEVPQEVLITTMKKHQKYFPVLDLEGNLQPKFIMVRNGTESSEKVRVGNEKVLTARLADARFFYQEDLKKDLDELTKKLKNVIFQKDIGNIYDKVQRDKEVAKSICKLLDINNDKRKNILRTIELSKADLVTNIINEKEYAKLQGFMGMKYALAAGEKEEVAVGIFEHYLPRNRGDILPELLEGIVSSIADKIDTIVSCFGVGIIPTGSEDPYALRRAAIGVVKVISNSKLDISIEDIIDSSLNVLEKDSLLIGKKENIKKQLMDFFKDRIKKHNQNKGYKKDITRAVIEADFTNIVETEKKIEALIKTSENKNFDNLLQLIKRVENIAQKYKKDDINIDETLLKDNEKGLYNYYIDLVASSRKNLKNKNYINFFDEILKGEKTINEYFDNVMVMAEDEEIRNNRLSLLKGLDNIFNKIAIISKIN